MSRLGGKWAEYVGLVESSAGELALNIFQDWKDEAKEDSQEFVELAKDKIPRWAEALAQGQIDKAEFGLLVRSLETLAQLNALKAKGLTKQKLEQFRTGLLSIAARAAFAVLGV